ncbi:MAG: hypothetical protein A2134_01815 [Candidatus Woykebacteria bacterium RBG_16_39_9b]|uniref:Uncharacterized protein n=1 Tax=Candidatus Woykebacteria bacterium RBG_16_39_9b TaxID=1802595 RepID=A0A1G1WF46_9BACT|nr:MAG: hypothetical protein A2134_01815 [Candidatus Woykebacteria bacterium RBG_16_39_9b]
MLTLNGKEVKGPLGYVLAAIAMFIVVVALLLAMAMLLSVVIGLVFGIVWLLLFLAFVLITVGVIAAMSIAWPILLLSSWTPFFVYMPVFVAWLLLLGLLAMKLVKLMPEYEAR